MSLPEVTIVTPQKFTWALHLPQFTSEIGLWVMSQATLPALLRESNSFQARSCSWRTRTLPQLHLQEATWSFKSIPSPGRDIWLHSTRQCLSPFRIQTAAWCLKLCFIVLCCCCLCCFCVSCWRWHKRQGLEHLTKRSIHSCPSAGHWGRAGTMLQGKILKTFQSFCLLHELIGDSWGTTEGKNNCSRYYSTYLWVSASQAIPINLATRA